jgi:4-alpha-glucanotransferase
MKTEMAFYIFLQYELHEQCKEVRNKAKGYKIVLKGDLPIGVGRNSVETWTRPVLFHMDEQAGAPPDAFTKKGQNWFFPTYNWDEMEKDNYQWWTSRMVLLGQYFDAIRIDHILGFFRIWSIPISAKEGLLGRFVPAKGFSRFEIENWGLGTHLNKLCNPFYTDKLMQTKFGEKWIEIKSVFFDANGFNNEFETQQALIDFVSSHPEWEEFLDGLLELKTDLVFLQDPKDVETFHFRINMMDTDSFKSLSWNDQMLLKEKYYDYFFRNQNEDWKLRGAQKLEHIKHASSMMICAEDLGMVPDFVEGVLQEKEMLTLQVQRMPKKMGVAFSNPADASYLSVVTPSTHDMSPLRMWWEEDRSMTQKFYQEVMHAVGKEPELCSEEVVRWIVNDHLHSPAMWSIFLIQDMISISKKYWNPDLSLDRINNPANPYHYWNYRMQINIETLIKDSAYNNMIKDMIVESGRAN